MISVNLQFASVNEVNDFVLILEAGAKQLGFNSFRLTDQVIRSTIEQANKQVANDEVVQG